MHNRFLIIAVIACFGFAASQGHSDEPKKDDGNAARKDLARATILTLELAVKVYYIKYDELPKKLDDLLVPPAGGKSLIEPDKTKLQDPWGKNYQFETKEVKGEIVIKIWTIAPDGTRIDNERNPQPKEPEPKKPTHAEKDAAKIAAGNLEKAVNAYYIKYGEYPVFLIQLVKPGNKDQPFVENKKALQDPWGKEYQFKLEEENGQFTVRIWTIAPDGTRIDNAKKK
jgi:Type II secretion system (T2SS), protein G